MGAPEGLSLDDPQRDETTRFGLLYVATSADVAFTESVLHENSTFMGGAFVLSAAELLAREVVTFKHPTKTTLRVADLTRQALKRLGLNNDFSASASYGPTQKWARAVHTALPHLDGIRYVSRQFNTQFCFAVFDRSGLLMDGQSTLTTANLGQLCPKFNIQAL